MTSKSIDGSKVAIYGRYSTEDQGEGTSKETQIESCLFHARAQGWVVPPDMIFFDEGYSGATLDRPAISKLRALVREGRVECVIVNTIDRLSRNIVDAVNLVLGEWDGVCHVKCVRQPIDTTTELGRMIFSILAMFADFERSQIRARTFGGRVKRAADGANPGIRLPYGYKRGQRTGEVVIDPEQAAIVRRIFSMYADGMGARAIAHTLNAEGLTSYFGRNWERSVIRSMIANERYIGVWTYGKTRRNERAGKDPTAPRRVTNDVPLAEANRPDLAIIDMDLWERCQKQRKTIAESLKRTSGKGLMSDYLLTGLVYCQKCGHTLSPTKEGRGPRSYYVCNGRRNKGPSFCDSGVIPTEHVEALVLDQLKTLLFNDSATLLARWQAAVEETRESERTVIQQAKDRIKELEEELAHIRNDYRRRLISADTFNEFRAEIERELTEKKEVLVRAEARLARIEQYNSAHSLEEVLGNLRAWDSLSRLNQKLLIRKLVKRVNVYRKVHSDEPISAHIELEQNLLRFTDTDAL